MQRLFSFLASPCVPTLETLQMTSLLVQRILFMHTFELKPRFIPCLCTPFAQVCAMTVLHGGFTIVFY
jgi:hypothetical protein